MKHYSLGLFAVTAMAAASFPTLALGDALCSAVFSKGAPAEAKYREAVTNALPTGEFVATSARRESLIQAELPKMNWMIFEMVGEYGKGDIPWMRLVPEEGAQVSYISTSQGLDHIVTKIVVRGKEPKLRATLLLPVSGHSNDGGANARRWAKTDKYNVNVVKHEMSARTGGAYQFDGNYGTPLVDHAQSLETVTMQEVEIPLNPNPAGSVTVQYWRHGSAGIEGYVEGRLIEIFYDPTP